MLNRNEKLLPDLFFPFNIVHGNLENMWLCSRKPFHAYYSASTTPLFLFSCPFSHYVYSLLSSPSLATIQSQHKTVQVPSPTQVKGRLEPRIFHILDEYPIHWVKN